MNNLLCYKSYTGKTTKVKRVQGKLAKRVSQNPTTQIHIPQTNYQLLDFDLVSR